MKPNTNPVQNPKDPLPFTGDDALEYSAIRCRLSEALDKFGGYEPAIDDLYLDQIARNTIFQRKADLFLMSVNATEHTFASIADAKVKFAKIIDNALTALAIPRQNRLNKQTQTNLETEFREALRRICTPATGSTS